MHRVLSALVVSVALLLSVAAAEAATVRIKVNGDPITDIQIAQRESLMKLEGKSGQQAAIDELVNEALELQEAKRLNITVTDAEVDDGVLQLARQIKVSLTNLQKVLTDHGVGMQTLRDRMKANLAWNKVTAGVINQRVQISDADIDKAAKAKLTAANSFDYILKEVFFIMPGGKGNAASRTAQANQYRKSYNGCASAVQLSLSYTDAAVRDIGRRNANQLPPPIADELSKLNVGGITTPRVVDGGVSMLAICAKEASTDTTFIANDLRQNAGNGALKTETDKYLANLKAKAQIIGN